jgi:hypothetical protein
MPVSPARVTPPWLDEQMPPEPPALRLVETRAESYGRTGDPLTDPLGFPKLDSPPVLRVIDGGGERGGRVGINGNGDARSYETAEQPAADGDLLIFSQTASSAWFTQVDEEHVLDAATASWGEYADEGWRVAEQASRPAVGAETMAGLPRRVPQANLVPGSVLPPSRPLRIVRDPESIAAHTTGYFRGWRRGQEIGGFAVGQRDRAAWEFNREQRAREQGRDTDQRVRRP